MRHLYGVIILVVSLALILLNGSSALFSPTYIYRIIHHGESDYYDFKIFPERHIAAGKFGQYLYVSPENNVVIVRNGITEGRVDDWLEVLTTPAHKVGDMRS